MEHPRTRSRADQTDVPYWVRNANNGVVVDEGSVETLSYWERFDDDPNPARSHGRFTAKPCDHRKVEIKTITPVPTTVGTFTYVYELSQYPLPMRVEDCEWLCADLVAQVTDRDSTVSRLQTKVMSQFPPTLDLGSFLLESKQSLELIPKLFASWDEWVQTASNLGKGRRPRRLPTMDEMLSSNHLMAQFGLLPVLRDLEAMAAFSGKLVARLEQLRKWNGKISKRHERVSYEIPPPAIPSQFHGWYPGQRYGLHWEHGATRVEIGVSALLNCNLPGLDDWRGITAGALAMAGLNNPLAIAWEVTPFSFVADWVINIGDRLDRVGARPIAGLWDLTEWSWSMKLSRTSKIWYTGFEPEPDDDGLYPVNNWVEGVTAEVTQEVYVRDTEFPGVVIGLPLSAGQAGLALALLLKG